MAGKAHGGCLSGVLRLCLGWKGVGTGTNAEDAENSQRAQREYGGERKRRRSYAEVAEGIPNYLKR